MTLHEAKEIIEGTSFIKVNRAKKVSAFAGRSSITICKNENPSLYNRYKRFKDLHLEYKKKIDMKYGKRALSGARRKIK